MLLLVIFVQIGKMIKSQTQIFAQIPEVVQLGNIKVHFCPRFTSAAGRQVGWKQEE